MSWPAAASGLCRSVRARGLLSDEVDVLLDNPVPLPHLDAGLAAAVDTWAAPRTEGCALCLREGSALFHTHQ